MYKYVLFDLDGTIVDSGPGIINSVEYALNKFGINVNDISELRKFIGPPLKSSFMEFYGFTEENAETAVKYYREYYSDKGIFECELYPGIREMLDGLRSGGKTILLATSKPTIFALRILEHFSIAQYFDFVAGLDMNDLKSEKADIIRNGLENSGISDVSDVIMIGDRKHDIIGAHKLNMKCAAVMYGYGSADEFKEYGADYTVNDANDILKLCIQ